MNLIHVNGMCMPEKTGRRLALLKYLLAMKLFIVILILSFNVSANVYSQKINLSVSNASLREVMQQVRKQTGYNFFIQSDVLKMAKPVNVNLKQVDMEDALEIIFKDQPLTYEVKDMGILIKTKEIPAKSIIDKVKAFFSAIDIKGKVTDEQGNALPGASVKAGGKVTVTNGNGEFSLSGVDENFSVEISYIGYTTKTVKASNSSFLLIQLQLKSNELGETIIKGYYSTSKILNTGAVSSVKGEEIAKQPVSDVLMALEGKIPGLYISQASGVPGAQVNVVLRGRNSIANGTAPLYIVDGIPFNSKNLSQNLNAAYGQLSPFTSIRPEDIQSIDVLKDADATAIYGSRGANGVILITTKKGISGKTKVEMNVYTGIGKIANKFDLLNTQQYLAMRDEAFKNDNATPQDFDHDVNGDWDRGRYTDWQKELIGGTSKFTNATATLSGGNEYTQFLFGTSYRKETTVFPGSFNNQIGSANLNVNHTSEDRKFHVDISVNYSNINNRLPLTDFASLVYLAPDAPAVYNADGTLNWQNNTFENPFGGSKQKSTSITDNLISNLILSYKILKDVQLKSSFGYNVTNMNEDNILPFSSVNPINEMYGPPADIRQHIRSTNRIKSWIIEPQINYSKDFEGHHLDALIGATFQSSIQDALSETATGFSNDAIIESFAAGTKVSNRTGTNTLYKYTAGFARLGYNYQQKYVLNLTGRRDGSSRFGPRKQFGSFGAIGAAWVFSKEHFSADNLPFLSLGKIRGSIGKTGNDQLIDYAYLSTYTASSATYFGAGILRPTSLTNPLYGWETINKIEAALDLGFLKDQLQLSISYYRNRTTNQLVGYSLSGITGFPSVIANLPAVIQNKGVEFELSSIIVKKQNFTWTSNFNLSIPKNKLISFPNIAGSSYASNFFVGQPLTAQLNYEYKGIDPKTGLYTFKDMDGDGDISSAGDRVPKFYGQKFFGGLNNSVSYKNFSFDFMIQFVKQIGYSQNINTSAGIVNQNQPISVLDHWESSSLLGKYQKYSQDFGAVYELSSIYDNSDARRTDASFLRLKNVMLSWSIPSPLREKLKLQNLRIYAQGQNLLTITNFKGIDPENALSGGYFVVLPPLRLLTLGIQVSL
jgi:TonB-linked SusC/RagA family outer membrane protein